MIGRADIRGALRALDVRAGDALVTHSSLRAVGPIDGGAAALLDEFDALVGAQGHMAMPAFSYGFEGNDQAAAACFDPDRTPSAVGALSECFRRRPGVVRSAHPTHSMAIRGPEAERLARGHASLPALGRGSPMHRLIETSADILLIGVGFESLSMLHTAESVARVPYIHQFAYGYKGFAATGRLLTPHGIRTIPIIESPGCSSRFPVMEGPARDAGYIREGRLGNAAVLRVNGPALLALSVDRLARDPYLLLCPSGTCPACDARRPAARP